MDWCLADLECQGLYKKCLRISIKEGVHFFYLNKAFTYDRLHRFDHNRGNCWLKGKTGNLNMNNQGFTSGARCNYAQIPPKAPDGKYPDERKYFLKVIRKRF